MIRSDKAFKLPLFVRKPDGIVIELNKKDVQGDQGSDMNVILYGLVNFLGLKRYPFAEIGFQGLFIRTADHRETILKEIIWLDIGVIRIWRVIKCFVSPEIRTAFNKTRYLNLILKIPWLYMV